MKTQIYLFKHKSSGYILAHFTYMFLRDFLYQNRVLSVNKYQLKNATHHGINQSNTVELQTCARHVCFYCFQRAMGIGLKDRMHSSRY